MRISDWSSDVCSSVLQRCRAGGVRLKDALRRRVGILIPEVPKPTIEIIGESCYSPGMGSSVPHDFAVSIEPADIDFMGHVNNASYLKWVQAAVLSHWR